MSGVWCFRVGLLQKKYVFKMVTNAICTASFETKMAPIESHKRQLSIDTNFVFNGKILTFVMSVFWIPPILHIFQIPLVYLIWKYALANPCIKSWPWIDVTRGLFWHFWCLRKAETENFPTTLKSSISMRYQIDFHLAFFQALVHSTPHRTAEP